MSYYDYVRALDKSERDISNLIALKQRYPGEMDEQTHKVLRRLYQQTVLALDEKQKETGQLTETEKKIYEKCKQELSKTTLGLSVRMTGWLVVRTIIDAYESIYHLLPSGVKEGRVQHQLQRRGEEVLPGYLGFLSTLVDTYEMLVTNSIILDSVLGLANMYDAAKMGNDLYRVIEEDKNKSLAEAMLRYSDYAYSGKSDDTDYLPMPAERIPAEIREMYHESNGLFSSGHGLKAWIAIKENKVVVAFSGTDPLNIIMDYEDYVQIYSASVLYLEAAGLLRIMLEAFQTETFLVCGHSLGGGLAEFSVTANIGACKDRVKCYVYNPAGLGIKSLQYLKNERLNISKNHIWVYATCKDFVSLSGAKIGHFIQLPKTESNGHGMNSLYKCMKKYLETEEKDKNTTKITLNLYSCDSVSLRGWKTGCIKSKNEEIIYPLFRDYVSEGPICMNIQIYRELIQGIIHQDEEGVCFGIDQYINGDAFTVFNRLGIFAEEENDVCFTRESAASVVFFGPYGYGKQKWLRDVLDILSEKECPIDKSNFDRYFSRFANEYDIMMQAWLYLLKNIYGYDFYNYFRNEIAYKNAKLMIVEYVSESKVLYAKYDYSRKLTKEEYKQYLEEKKQIFNMFLESAGQEAVEYNLMSREEKEFVVNNIMEYLKTFVEKLTK